MIMGLEIINDNEKIIRLINELTIDVLQYIHVSNIFKANKRINDLVLLIEPKMKVYMNK